MQQDLARHRWNGSATRSKSLLLRFPKSLDNPDLGEYTPNMALTSLFSSGTLSKQWKEAKSKVDGAVLKEMKFQDDFGPELDKLEKARDDINGWVESIVKAGADVDRLRTSVLQTCAAYKLKAEGKTLSSLVTVIDGLRGQVESLAQEVGKVVEAARSVKKG
jgi:molecular chaperone GrpE (heat shock protein)